MNVDDVVAEKIAIARAKIQAAKERRASLAEARRHGIARRHAAKLAYLDAQERRAAERQDDEPEETA